jgi:MFS family permease
MAFVVGIAIFEAGSLLSALAPNSAALIIGRAISGVGGAGLGTGCFTIVGFSVPKHRVPAFIGLLGAIMSFSMVAGPLISGAFTDSKLSWRWW